jgi:glycosyltransferase involved in cell wall biosynthesis
MRVLFVHRFNPWPLDYGGSQRTFALIRGLASKHEVTLAVPEPRDEALRLAAEEGYRRLVSRFIWIRLPTEGGQGSSRRFAAPFRALRALVDLVTNWLPVAFREASVPWRVVLDQHRGEFDAVFCRYSNLAPALFGLDLRRVVFDLDDLQFLYLWRALENEARPLHRIRDTAEAIRTWLAEQIISFRSAHVLLCSREDANRVLCRRKSVVPNGVTLEAGSRAPRESDTLVFVGACRWPPNRHGLRWFIENVWPIVLAARPLTQLRIVGRDANYQNLPFAKRDGIRLIPNVPSVKPWVESSVVSIVPILFAGGTRIKIVESLGFGTPVVATRVGAAGLTESFDSSTGLHVVNGSEPMAAKLCELLANPAPAIASAERGARLVAERYTWDRVVELVVEEFERWVGDSRK